MLSRWMTLILSLGNGNKLLLLPPLLLPSTISIYVSKRRNQERLHRRAEAKLKSRVASQMAHKAQIDALRACYSCRDAPANAQIMYQQSLADAAFAAIVSREASEHATSVSGKADHFVQRTMAILASETAIDIAKMAVMDCKEGMKGLDEKVEAMLEEADPKYKKMKEKERKKHK